MYEKIIRRQKESTVFNRVGASAIAWMGITFSTIAGYGYLTMDQQGLDVDLTLTSSIPNPALEASATLPYRGSIIAECQASLDPAKVVIYLDDKWFAESSEKENRATGQIEARELKNAPHRFTCTAEAEITTKPSLLHNNNRPEIKRFTASTGQTLLFGNH